METRTSRQRDSKGHFIRTCRDCDTKAQWAIEGYGAYGLYQATHPVFCKTHGSAAVARMNKALGMGGYELVK